MISTERKSKLRNPSKEEIAVYNAINKAKDKSGVYHKTCFHLHTPASYDYKLRQEWTPEQYNEVPVEELFEQCQKERIILPHILLDDISEEDIRNYSSKKEFLSYVLLAERLIVSNIEVVLVTDASWIRTQIRKETCLCRTTGKQLKIGARNRAPRQNHSYVNQCSRFR